MLLAMDTAARTASVALYNAEGVQAELTWRSRDNHTVALMAQVVHLLNLAHATKADLQAIAVALGPGSFTGLRVGMSVAKGLAYGCKIPLLGIPTLDAVAHAHADQPLPIWAIVAAGRGRYSVARYTTRRGAIKRASDYVLANADELILLATRASGGEKITRAFFAGDLDPALAQKLRAQVSVSSVIASPAATARRASWLAELAWARFLRGENDDASSLVPLYQPHESVEGKST